MPPGEYCIIYIPEEKISYGIMHDEMHSKFMDILSGETLECFEYLDESDFKKIADIDKREVIGNAGLLDKLSL